MPLHHLISENFFSVFMNALNESFAHHEVVSDENGRPYDYRVLFINQAYEHSTGLTRDKILGKTIRELQPDIEDSWIQLCAEVARTGIPTSVERYMSLWNRYFKISIFSHQPGQFSTLFVDITDVKTSEEISRRYRNLLENSPDIVLFVDRHGTIVDANNAALSAYGYERAELIGASIIKLRTSASLTNFIEQFDQAISNGVRFETEHRRKDGSVFPVAVSSKSATDESGNLLMSIVRDISQQKRHESEIRAMATHDHLTGILNRVGFYEQMHVLTEHAERSKHKIAVLYFDLDDFKHVNDQYGHDIGDRVLRGFVERITPVVRSVDCFCRIGGDEFVLALSYVVSEENIRPVLDKIVESLEEPLRFDGLTLPLSSSIGIALYPDHSHNFLQLLQHADFAMYCSKKISGTHFTFYDSSTLYIPPIKELSPSEKA